MVQDPSIRQTAIKLESLQERARELQCLYRVDELTNNFAQEIDSLLWKLLDIIPFGWRYQDICQAEIIFEDKVYAPVDIIRTELKQSSLIKLYDTIVGEVRVYYTKPVKLEKGIFLAEEQRLLKAIAEKIATFIILRKLKPVQADPEDLSNSGTVSVDHIQREYPGILEWLKSFGLNNSDALLLLKTPLFFKKGETIGKQGAFTSYFLLVASGMTKSYIEGTGSRSYAFMMNMPFEFIGISSLFGNNFYFSTTAVVHSTVFLIEKEIFMHLMNSNQRFNIGIQKWYCDSYRILFQKLSSLALKQAMGRMAETLLYLVQDVCKGTVIPSCISRKDIAELSGMSNENAVRILSEFKGDGLVRDTSSGLEVINPELLHTISITG